MRSHILFSQIVWDCVCCVLCASTVAVLENVSWWFFRRITELCRKWPRSCKIDGPHFSWYTFCPVPNTMRAHSHLLVHLLPCTKYNARSLSSPGTLAALYQIQCALTLISWYTCCPVPNTMRAHSHLLVPSCTHHCVKLTYVCQLMSANLCLPAHVC